MWLGCLFAATNTTNWNKPCPHRFSESTLIQNYIFLVTMVGLIRGSYSNNHSTKKITKPFKVYGDTLFFFHLTENGWIRRGGKGVVGKFSFRIVCQNIIPFSLGLICHVRALNFNSLIYLHIHKNWNMLCAIKKSNFHT